MSDTKKKYFCLCGSNCKYETMTKEQIIAALAAATSQAYVEDGCLYFTLDGGVVVDGDAAFITQIMETNAGESVSVWVGTEAEFNALSPAVKADSFVARIDENGKVYICTNDSFMALLKKTVHEDYIMVGDMHLDEQTVDVLNKGGIKAGRADALVNQSPNERYTGKDVKVSYEVINPEDIDENATAIPVFFPNSDGTVLAKATGWWGFSQILKNYIGGGGGTAGMEREFHIHKEADEKSIYAAYAGTASKIYVITLVDETESNEPLRARPQYTTVTIDYKGVHEDDEGRAAIFRFPYVRPNGQYTYFEISVDTSAGVVTFTLGGEARTLNGEVALSISDVCGYY